MKKAVLLFLVFSVLSATAQLSDDEKLRKKILTDYLDQVYFEYSTPQAEALANIIIKSFKENLVIISVEVNDIPETDALKIASLKLVLQNLLDSQTPSWQQIIEIEKERLIMLDKQLRRKSKYESDPDKK
jgi:hypothetical protein